MAFRIFKSKPAASSRFSEFIRNADSRERKRVYRDVLAKATARQNRTAQASADRFKRADG